MSRDFVRLPSTARAEKDRGQDSGYISGRRRVGLSGDSAFHPCRLS
jgi:hypothetical protein